MENYLEKLHPVLRFNNRSKNYSKYRPDYPETFFSFLVEELSLNEQTICADIGSGTGLFAEHLLKKGCKTVCIEPNDEMRAYAEMHLSHYNNFVSIKGRAEETLLEPQSVNHIFIAQAFHWMNAFNTKSECLRILKPNGKIFICWILATQNSLFLKDYERLRQKFAVDYKPVKRNNEKVLHEFFAPSKMIKKVFSFRKQLSFDSLKGLLLSVSFIPQPEDDQYEEMMENLLNLFNKYNINGYVEMDYELIAYWNQ